LAALGIAQATLRLCSGHRLDSALICTKFSTAPQRHYVSQSAGILITMLCDFFVS